MSDEEKNRPPETDDSPMDDDLDSLSDDEKSAFEKIMAEIATTEGKPATGSSEDPSGDTESENAPKGSPDTKDPSADSKDPAAASAGESTSHADGDAPTDPASAREKDPPETGAEDDGEELTGEQQAALDQIMAEIEGQAPPEQAPQPADADPADDAVEEDLSDDQQAALDKIMGEISERKQADAPPAAEAATADDDADKELSDDDAETELSDDQQAALDKIMGEINGRKEADAPPAAETAPADEGADKELSDDDAEAELSDDQQAALDKIMGEINGRKEADAPPAAETAPADDQPAALDEIVPETNSSGQSDDTGSTEDNTTQSTPPDEGQDADLSVEEFNEELTHLLSGAEGKSEADTAQKPPEQPQPPRPVDEKDAEPPEQPPAPYTMLKEVADSEKTASSAPPKPRSSGAWSRRMKKVLQFSAALSVAVALIGLGALAYRFFDSGRRPNVSENAVPSELLPVATPDPAVAPVDLGQSAPSAPSPAASESRSPQDSLLTMIRHDLENAREQLAAKKKELQDLKTYYQKGIVQEQSKVAARAASAKLSDYRTAIKNSRVELALRSIQRRMVYLKKLDTPLDQVDAALEELLYWQRRTQLLELLSSGISGLPISEFKQEVEQIMQQHLEKSQKLSIEHINVSTPGLAAIWKELFTKKAGKRAAAPQMARPDTKDLAIGKEICSGNFEHLYLLTQISDATAACLVRWSGKDLYLNELTHLSPAAAQSLAQWPGERLSLNGIKSLSAESAKYLSQWPGKWLSLNGLTHLSNPATAYLAQWQGEQLEMVGLDSIGSWENYVTRLYLSEQLRRKLDLQ